MREDGKKNCIVTEHQSSFAMGEMVYARVRRNVKRGYRVNLFGYYLSKGTGARALVLSEMGRI